MIYRIRFHPSVADDLDWIAEWISDYAGASSAVVKLDEIEQVIRSLALTPHRRSRRDEIAPGLRAIPAGRKGIVVFAVDDDLREVLIYAVSYGGADWVRRSRARSCATVARETSGCYCGQGRMIVLTLRNSS